MSAFKKRVDNIERAFFGDDASRYRELCLQFNLRNVSSDDLWESLVSIIEDRPMNPDVEARLFAPIPRGTSQSLIDRAHSDMGSSHNELSNEDMALRIEEYNRGVSDGYIVPGGYAKDLMHFEKGMLIEEKGVKWWQTTEVA